METDLWGVWRVNPDDLYRAVQSLMFTLLLVTGALLIAGLMSVWLAWKGSRNPHPRRWDVFDSLLNFMGGVPIFFLCFLVRDYRFELNDKGLGWLLPLMAGPA